MTQCTRIRSKLKQGINSCACRPASAGRPLSSQHGSSEQREPPAWCFAQGGRPRRQLVQTWVGSPRGRVPQSTYHRQPDVDLRSRLRCASNAPIELIQESHHGRGILEKALRDVAPQRALHGIAVAATSVPRYPRWTSASTSRCNRGSLRRRPHDDGASGSVARA